MSLIQWKDEYSLGIEKIDKQHQGLFDLINELYDAMVANSVKEVLNQTVAKLKSYTLQHFHDEETYMRFYNFPNYTVHCQEHKLFIEKVKDFEENFVKGSVLLSISIIQFLEDWLIHHICNSDKKIGVFIHESIVEKKIKN